MLFLWVGICSDLDCDYFHGEKKAPLLIDSYMLAHKRASLCCYFKGNHLLPLVVDWRDEIFCRFDEIFSINLHQSQTFKAVIVQSYCS